MTDKPYEGLPPQNKVTFRRVVLDMVDYIKLTKKFGPERQAILLDHLRRIANKHEEELQEAMHRSHTTHVEP